jgi:hemerythrin-like domain-containing protein
MVSEFTVPDETESAFPVFARYRQRILALSESFLESKQELLAWAKKRVPLPLALNMGRLQHESMRHWMHEAQTLAKSSSSSASAEVSTRLSLVWGYLVDFVQEHSVLEDAHVYPILEKAKPGCTEFSQREHKDEIPKLHELARELETWSAAGNEAAKDQSEEIESKVTAACDALEHHLRHEEEKLFPILSTLTEEEHRLAFPAVYHSCDAAREKLFGFVLQGLNLSQQVAYVQVCITCAPLSQENTREVLSFLKNSHAAHFMSPARAQKIEEHVLGA